MCVVLRVLWAVRMGNRRGFRSVDGVLMSGLRLHGDHSRGVEGAQRDLPMFEGREQGVERGGLSASLRCLTLEVALGLRAVGGSAALPIALWLLADIAAWLHAGALHVALWIAAGGLASG